MSRWALFFDQGDFPSASPFISLSDHRGHIEFRFIIKADESRGIYSYFQFVSKYRFQTASSPASCCIKPHEFIGMQSTAFKQLYKFIEALSIALRGTMLTI